MPEVIINYLAVLVAAIASMVLGAIWYSPSVLGKIWMKLSGVKHPKHAGQSYFIAFISSIVMSYVLAHFVDYAGASTVSGGMLAGFWAWLGFIATVTLGPVIWEGKPVQLYVLNNAYNLLSLMVMGVILAVWI